MCSKKLFKIYQAQKPGGSYENPRVLELQKDGTDRVQFPIVPHIQKRLENT